LSKQGFVVAQVIGGVIEPVGFSLAQAWVSGCGPAQLASAHLGSTGSTNHGAS
jgi:hypothetical protein